MLDSYFVQTEQDSKYLKIGKDQLKELYNEHGQKHVNKAIAIALQNHFPEKKLCISKERLGEMYQALRAYVPEFLERSFRITNLPNHSNLTLEGRPCLLLTKPEYYHRFNLLPEYFTDLERMTAKRLDQELSPLDYWKQRTLDVVQHCTKKYRQINAHALREALYESVHECTEFKTTLWWH